MKILAFLFLLLAVVFYVCGIGMLIHVSINQVPFTWGIAITIVLSLVVIYFGCKFKFEVR